MSAAITIGQGTQDNVLGIRVGLMEAYQSDAGGVARLLVGADVQLVPVGGTLTTDSPATITVVSIKATLNYGNRGSVTLSVAPAG